MQCGMRSGRELLRQTPTPMICFHKRESQYPPKGISFPIKDRKFLLNPREGYCSQLQQAIDLQRANGLFESREATKALLMPYWCEMRPELCANDQPRHNSIKKAVPARGKAVEVKKQKRGGCGGCGGGRVR